MQSLTEREQSLIDLIVEDPNCSVSRMSKTLQISSVTVRSVLNSLADKGMIVRTWGGAVPAFHPAMAERQRAAVEDKHRIAQAAAALVDEGDTIMIEAGTTTALVARYILGKRGISVVSNSTLIIPYARANPQLSLTMVGGSFRPQTESFVGPIAVGELERFHVRTAFVGTDGFTIEHGLSTHLVEGAEIVRKMAQQAERVVMVADSSKWGHRGFVAVLPLSGVTHIISDVGLPQQAYDELTGYGLEVQRV
ncbi:MAG: DeoR/GlpR transcriptional regulator [Spirochaetaceae bacterium]|nr:MAG: DeoR/GlpR transcriptional regulator [Spirochaetaceae bacterium]